MLSHWLAIIPQRRFSHIWLQISYESRDLLKSFFNPGYLLEKCVEKMVIF
jgi:hypothetical protein